MKFTCRARYNGSSRSKRIAFCSREPRIRQFRSQAACERCTARIYPRASRHKSRPFRVYVPKCVAKIYSQLPACSIEFKRIQRFNGFTILATVRDCKDAMDPKPQVFKDLKLCNAELFRSKSLQRAPLYSCRFLHVGIYRSKFDMLCKCSSESKDLKI